MIINKKCRCGGDMIIKRGAYGQFWGCKNYPTCKNTDSIVEKNKEFLEKYGVNKRDVKDEVIWKSFIFSDKKIKQDYQIGYVYIIYFKYQNFYKIGCSIDYNSRIVSLAGEHKIPKEKANDFYLNPMENIEIKKIFKTYNYETLEKQLHFLFKDKNVYKNEYFSLTEEDLEKIDNIKSICGIGIEKIEFNNSNLGMKHM